MSSSETAVATERTPGKIISAMTWAFAVMVFAMLVLIRWVGVDWWGVAVLLFMPRWVFLVPIVGLAIASGLKRCYGHWIVQGAMAVVVAGPLMGMSLPLGQLVRTHPSGEVVRVGTANLGLEGILSVPALRKWIETSKLDVVCLQEGNRDAPELVAYLADGWHVNRRKTIASRYPIVAELSSLPDQSDTDKRYPALLDRVRLRTPAGASFVVASIHMPTLRPGFHALLDGDVAGMQMHLAWWRKEGKRVLTMLDETRGDPLIVAGDFNMPADDSAMGALASSFRFAFEEGGWGYGYTRPAQYPWVRIDHILTGPEWTVVRAAVGPNIGSDHRPMSAELILPDPRAGGVQAGK